MHSSPPRLLAAHQHGLGKYSVLGGRLVWQQTPHRHIQQQPEGLVEGGTTCAGGTHGAVPASWCPAAVLRSPILPPIHIPANRVVMTREKSEKSRGYGSVHAASVCSGIEANSRQHMATSKLCLSHQRKGHQPEALDRIAYCLCFTKESEYLCDRRCRSAWQQILQIGNQRQQFFDSADKRLWEYRPGCSLRKLLILSSPRMLTR